jgi:hypothetical protein
MGRRIMKTILIALMVCIGGIAFAQSTQNTSYSVNSDGSVTRTVTLVTIIPADKWSKMVAKRQQDIQSLQTIATQSATAVAAFTAKKATPPVMGGATTVTTNSAN